MRRFSSRSTLTSFSRCSVQVLPTSVQTGATDSASSTSAGSSAAATPRRRVMPKAAIWACAKRSRGEQLEELALLRVRRREAGLDQLDAELVEAVGDAQLLLGGERHALALHAVAQGGVI